MFLDYAWTELGVVAKVKNRRYSVKCNVSKKLMTVSIQKFRIIVLVSNRIEYWSNYSIRNFEYSHSTRNEADHLSCLLGEASSSLVGWAASSKQSAVRQLPSTACITWSSDVSTSSHSPAPANGSKQQPASSSFDQFCISNITTAATALVVQGSKKPGFF